MPGAADVPDDAVATYLPPPEPLKRETKQQKPKAPKYIYVKKFGTFGAWGGSGAKCAGWPRGVL